MPGCEKGCQIGSSEIFPCFTDFMNRIKVMTSNFQRFAIQVGHG